MFTCSICGEESTRICVRCTKDTCSNHLCERCGRCSDCCECEVPLSEPLHDPPMVHSAVHAGSPPVPHPERDPDPKPEPPHPAPDPDPFSQDDTPAEP